MSGYSKAYDWGAPVASGVNAAAAEAAANSRRFMDVIARFYRSSATAAPVPEGEAAGRSRDLAGERPRQMRANLRRLSSCLRGP